MKTGILLLNLLLFCYLGNTQILFEQDFSADTIAPMTSVDNDGFIPVPNLEHIGSSWKVFRERAYAVSNFTQPNKADNWLITPAISISSVNTLLTWYSAPTRSNVPESYKVMISTTTNELDQFTEEIFTLEEAGRGKYHTLLLDAFIGSTIYIAFVHQTFGGVALCLDNITVKVHEGNHEWVHMYVKTYPFYKKNHTPMSLKVDIYNYGVDYNNVELYYMEGKEEIALAEIKNLGNFQTVEATVISENQTDTEDLSFYLRDSNGKLLGTTQRSVQILKDSPKKKILIEETSATWCGWCPAATVFFEKLQKIAGQDYIGIAVHEQDTLSLKSEHTTDYYFRNIIGIPDLSFDHFFYYIHPDDGEEKFLSLQNILASPFDLQMETNYNEIDRTVHIEVATNSMVALANLKDRFRISLLLTEDNIRGETDEFSQSNYYSDRQDLYNIDGTINWRDLPNPIPASDMVYNKVLRATLSPYHGFNNSLPELIEKGKTYTYSLAYKIPEEFDPHSCNVIAIIKDTQNYVSINAASVPVISTTTTAVSEFDSYSLEVYPNPAQEVLIVKQTSGSTLHYRLVSLNGSIYKSGLLPTAQNSLDINALPKGVYFLEIWNSDKKERFIEKVEKF